MVGETVEPSERKLAAGMAEPKASSLAAPMAVSKADMMAGETAETTAVVKVVPMVADLVDQ